ncbi:S-adenosyl-L-methionine-dependent methyltransferase [Westerdykella ornata]|uniref:S-adenosyl-L-methionine-dependent methyltransferase n=1 Tax=Westerdykella ornata TaxID=318751 RepID=A0A6A6JR03_WESOR|nr:S-adenosyl-L-methionine-dependent methyltransferase [Westerdykella ornata]KAF2278817.1 S-adenosyl-L-methionine-dependent methyltransferase [Westerdykella ornata]
MAGVHEDLRRVIIHERDFQKLSIDNRIYCVPVDEREELRLESQHDILFRFFDHKLYLPRVREPRKVLECGYGTGDWAVAMAEEFEDCEVTAVDIYPVLIDQPDNLTLFGYNLNDRLNDPEVFQRRAYDLIHSRFVGPGIKTSRWGSYIRDMKSLLRPNGWVQIMEYYPNIQSWSGRLADDSALTRWYRAYVSAMERANRNVRIGQRLQHYMTEAGLRDVGVSIVHLPIGDWDPDPRKAEIGRDNIAVVAELLESLAIWPFTELLGWSVAQVLTLINLARSELQDASLKLYIPM